MSTTREEPLARWSKTQAECPVCHRWMTRQGLNGHIRFRHQRYWAVDRALTMLLKAGNQFAQSLVLSDEPISEADQKLLFALYRRLVSR